jgi:hypothetical protein
MDAGHRVGVISPAPITARFVYQSWPPRVRTCHGNTDRIAASAIAETHMQCPTVDAREGAARSGPRLSCGIAARYTYWVSGEQLPRSSNQVDNTIGSVG